MRHGSESVGGGGGGGGGGGKTEGGLVLFTSLVNFIIVFCVVGKHICPATKYINVQ